MEEQNQNKKNNIFIKIYFLLWALVVFSWIFSFVYGLTNDGGGNIFSWSKMDVFVFYISWYSLPIVVLLIFIFSIIRLIDSHKNKTKTSIKGILYLLISVLTGLGILYFTIFYIIGPLTFEKPSNKDYVSNLKRVESKGGITLNAGLEKWEKSKIKNNNSYSYSFGSISMKSGYTGYRITPTIKNGEIINTSYAIWDNDKLTDFKVFTDEEIKNIDFNMPPPMTMDELYDFCKEYPKDNYWITMSEEGFVKGCGLLRYPEPYNEQCTINKCSNNVYVYGFEWLD